MSGVAIIRSLLVSDAALIASVPASRIKAGVLPLDITLPAISVTQVSGNQHNNVAMNSADYLITDRVQVTVFTKDVSGASSGYATKKSILALVRAACPLSRGTINGFASEGVLPDTTGPDLDDLETQIFSQSQDYMVSYIR